MATVSPRGGGSYRAARPNLGRRSLSSLCPGRLAAALALATSALASPERAAAQDVPVDVAGVSDFSVVAAGRWSAGRAWLDVTSTGFVTVQLSSTDPNVEFHPDNGKVVIERSTQHPVSIRYAANAEAEVTAPIRAEFSSSQERYDGVTDDLEVTFGSNSDMRVTVCCDADSNPVDSNSLDAASRSTPLTVTLTEGHRHTLTVGVAAEPLTDHPVTVSLIRDRDGDQRVFWENYAGSGFVLDDPASPAEVTIGTGITGAAAGRATIDLQVHTRDGAYNMFGASSSHLGTLQVVVAVQPTPLSVGVAASASPGNAFTDITVSLVGAPSEGVRIEITNGDAVAGVQLNPGRPNFDLDATSPPRILQIRYNPGVDSPPPITARITTSTTSTDSRYNGLMVVSEIVFTGAIPAVFISEFPPRAAGSWYTRGVWTHVTVGVTGAREAAVTLTVKTGDGFTEFEPQLTPPPSRRHGTERSATIVLDRFETEARLSMRTFPHNTATRPVSLTVDVDSSETAFNGLSATRSDLSFIGNNAARIAVQGPHLNSFNDYPAGRTRDITLRGGETFTVQISLIANPTQGGVSITTHKSGNPQVAILGGHERIYLYPPVRAGNRHRALTISVQRSPSDFSDADISFTFFSDDDAYRVYHSQSGRSLPRLRVKVLQSPIEFNAPAGAPINADVPVTVSLSRAPAADVVVGLSSTDSTLTFDPDMVTFTATEQEFEFNVRYDADDFTDGETREVEVVATSPSGSGDFEGWTATATITFSQPGGIAATDLPAEVAAGRWAETVVRLLSAPAAGMAVEVSLETTQANLAFDPPSGTLTLDATAMDMTLSLHYDGYLDADVEMSGMLRSSSTDPDFNDQTVDLMTTIGSIWDAGWLLTADAGLGSNPSATPQSPNMTVTVTKNSETPIIVRIEDNDTIPVEAGITVSMELLDAGDARVGIKDGTDSLAFTTTGRWPPDQSVVVEVSDSDVGSGLATIRFRMNSDDGAYREYGEHHGTVAFAVIEVIEQPALLISDPVGIVAQGGTRPVTVSLNVRPPLSAHPIPVALTSPDADVNISGSPKELTQDNYQTGVVFDVSYSGAYADETTVSFVAETDFRSFTLFDNLRATLSVDVIEAPLLLSAPDAAVAGRWTDVVVEAVVPPSEDVMVTFTKDLAEMKFSPDLDTTVVVLSAAQTRATVPVRHAGHLSAAAEGEVRIAAASADSLYSGLEATVDASFTSSEDARARIYDPHGSSSELTGDPSVIGLVEGATLVFEVDLASAPESDVMVTFDRQTAGADGRVSEVGPNRLTFTSSNHGTRQRVTVTAAYTGAADGMASYSVGVSSSDGAFAVREASEGPLGVRVDVSRLVMSSTDPGRVSAGTWADLSFELDQAGTTVTLDLSSTDSDVAFHLDPAQLVLEGTGEESISVRLDADLASDRTVPIRAVGTGPYTGLSATRNVVFFPNPLRLSQPDAAVAGRWTMTRVSLAEAPSSDVNVQLSADPAANVEFDPTSGLVVLNAGTRFADVPVRYDAYAASDVIVDIEAVATSSDTNYDDQEASTRATFGSSDVARWTLGNGSGITVSPQDASTEVTVEVTKGQRVNLELSLDGAAPVSPTANVTVDIAASSGAGLIASINPTRVEFDSSNHDQVIEVAVEAAADSVGVAQIDFDMTTSDRAYELYATQHGDSLSAEVNVLDQPLSMTDPPDVAAGRWTVAELSLLSSPAPAHVDVALSSEAGIVINPSSQRLTGTTPVMVSIRAAANADAERDIEVTARSTSSDAEFDENEVVVGISIGPNTEMTVGATAPSSKVDEGTTFNVEVELGADVQAGETVDVGVSVTDEDGGRASASTGTLRFTDASRTETLMVVVSPSPDTREPDFEVWVTLSVLSSSTDGAFALRAGGASVTATVRDTTAGMLSFSPGSFSITEGSSDSIEVRPSARPTVDVVVDLVPGGSALTADPAQLTFTPDDWQSPQRSVLSAADDDVAGDGVSANLELRVTSDDDNFAGAVATPVTVPVEIVEDDVASLSIAPSSPVRFEAGEGAEWSVALTSEPASEVTVEFSLNLGSSVLPDGLLLALRDGPVVELEFTPSDWNTAQSVTVTALVEADQLEIEDDIPFEIEVDSRSDDDAYDITLALQGEVRRGNLGAAEHVGKAVAAVDLGSMQFALDVVGAQVASVPTAANLNLSPKAADPEDGDLWSLREGGWRSDFSELVGRSAGFSLPLDDDGSVVMWSRLGYFDVSGTTPFEDEEAEYEGEALGLVYGFDWRRSDGSSFGIALSHTGSTTELDNAGDLREIEGDVVALHPYYGVELAGGYRTWVVGSLGRGDVDIALADGSTVGTGTSSRAIGVGLERSWRDSDLGYRVRLEGITGSGKLEESDDLTREGIVEEDGSPIESEMLRMRLELEVSKVHILDSGQVILPYLTAGGRFDGGDIDDVYALEAGGGVRFALAGAYGVDLNARLQLNDADHNEHSVSGRIAYDAGADRRGVVASYVQELEEDSASGEASVGYGWGTSVFGQRGVFGPTLRYESDDGFGQSVGFDSDRLRLKADFDGDGYELSLDLIGN